MPINSCRKGKNGERAWAKWLQENLDPSARRGFGQSAGGASRPDVETSIAIHSEVKCVERLNLDQAMSQAIRDAQPGKVPIVAHKRNRGPWHVTLLASNLIELAEIVVKAQEALKDDDSGTDET